MNTIVTGGKGCIGSHIIDGLKIGRDSVDLTDFKMTLEFFGDLKPDAIIHSAAKQGNYANMNEEKVAHFSENMRINLNVFEAARQAGVRKLIALSTTTAFPYKLSGNASEDDLFSGEIHQSCYAHGYAKRMIEVLCRSHREQYGLDYTCLFLSNVYGPGFSSKNGVIPFLINRCMDSKKAGTFLDFIGDGSQTRDFIFVDDVAQIIDKIKNYNNFPFSSMIISTGRETSIREILFSVCNNLDFNTDRINWLSSENMGQLRKVFSNDRLMSVFPDQKFKTIDEGIGKIIENSQ